MLVIEIVTEDNAEGEHWEHKIDPDKHSLKDIAAAVEVLYDGILSVYIYFEG